MSIIPRNWHPRLRAPLLAISATLVFVIALADYFTEPYLSIGFLYLFPLVLAAGFLPRWAICLAGLGCAGLSEAFGQLGREWLTFRLTLESLAFISSGLLVHEMILSRNRLLAAREHLRILVDTSPAAILTVGNHGVIELANRAALELLLPEGGTLEGQPIAIYLPQLHHALRREGESQLRATMQCEARREDGSTFAAEVWFSTYREDNRPKLAAIVADIEGEVVDSPGAVLPEGKPLADREIEVMRLVLAGLANKQIAYQMGISESTVKNVLQQLFARFGVRTRSQLVRIALEQYRDLF